MLRRRIPIIDVKHNIFIKEKSRVRKMYETFKWCFKRWINFSLLKHLFFFLLIFLFYYNILILIDLAPLVRDRIARREYLLAYRRSHIYNNAFWFIYYPYFFMIRFPKIAILLILVIQYNYIRTLKYLFLAQVLPLSRRIRRLC